MSIKYCSYKTRYANRYLLITHSKETRNVFTAFFNNAVIEEVIFIIWKEILRRTVSKFVIPETLISYFRPTKTELFKSFLFTPFDRFPHYKVVGAALLSCLVGGSILVNSLRSMMKEYNSCNHSIPECCK